jgi:hypothetical protein
MSQCYKAEGRRFESRMRWIFFFNLPNPSNRTMALGNHPGVKNNRRVGLTTLPPSVSRMSENVGASNSRNPKGLHGLYRDKFTITCVCVR